MTKKMLSPVHPGEVLLEEFLKPMELSQNQLALSLGVHARKINEIVLGKRRVTAETALRLGASTPLRGRPGRAQGCTGADRACRTARTRVGHRAG